MLPCSENISIYMKKKRNKIKKNNTENIKRKFFLVYIIQENSLFHSSFKLSTRFHKPKKKKNRYRVMLLGIIM